MSLLCSCAVTAMTCHAFAAELLIKCRHSTSIAYCLPSFIWLSASAEGVCVIVCERKMSPARVTHPFSVQQQVDSEDHTVVHRNLLISVQDLKYPAEHRAVVNPRRAEAAFLWCGAQQQTRYAISSTVVSFDSHGYNSELCHNVQRESTTKHFRTLMNIDGAKTNQGLNYGLFI